MAATNIFYRIPSQRGTKVASIAGTECTLDQFCDYIIDIEGLNRQDFIIASGTKVFRPSSCNLQLISLQNNSNVDILIPLLGGKGGFGSLLRAIGAQIEKTTNRDACRDLSGRRLRDIKREDELKKLIELQAKLDEERKRRKKEKLESLRKKNEISKTSASIQELVAMFDDHAFNKRRLELSDIIDAAVEKGLINSKKRQPGSVTKNCGKKQRLERDSRAEPSMPELTENKSAVEAAGTPDHNELPASKLPDDTNSSNKVSHNSIKRNDLWLGLEDEELGEESEENEENEDDEKKEPEVAVNR